MEMEYRQSYGLIFQQQITVRIIAAQILPVPGKNMHKRKSCEEEIVTVSLFWGSCALVSIRDHATPRACRDIPFGKQVSWGQRG